MVSLGHDEIAKYPFLAEAGKYLQDKGFTLEQFATDPDLQIIVDKAYERIEYAANGLPRSGNPHSWESLEKQPVIPVPRECRSQS